jgi:hypothetical protein
MATKTETAPTYSQDLTVAFIDEDRKLVITERSGRTCGPKSRFSPGMDARTKGTLQTAFRLGFKLLLPDGSTSTAEAAAKSFGLERFLTAKPKRVRSTSTLPYTEVKVGRSWRPVVKATKKGDGFRVTYQPAKGEPKTVEAEADKLR